MQGLYVFCLDYIVESKYNKHQKKYSAPNYLVSGSNGKHHLQSSTSTSSCRCYVRFQSCSVFVWGDALLAYLFCKHRIGLAVSLLAVYRGFLPSYIGTITSQYINIDKYIIEGHIRISMNQLVYWNVTRVLLPVLTCPCVVLCEIKSSISNVHIFHWSHDRHGPKFFSVTAD